MREFKRTVFSLLILALIVALGGGCTKQARKSRYLARANRDFEAQQYDKAEIEYLAVLRLPPPDPVAVSHLGLLYHAEGKRLQSLLYLRQAVKMRPDEIEARLKLGSTYLWFRQLKEAREQATSVLQSQADNAEALLLLAQSALTPEYVQETQRLFEKFPGKTADPAGCHVARGTLYLQSKQLDQAETEFRQALAQDPKSSFAYLGLSDVYAQRQDLKQTESTLKTAAELAPLRSPVRLRYAGLLLQLGQAKQATAAVEALVQKAPDYVPGLVFLAQTAVSQGRTADGAALVNKILARDRMNFEALLLNGNLMLAKGDGTNAITQFERLVSTYGPTPQAEYSLALAQVMAKQEAKAMASLSRALAADTNFVQAILLQASLNVRQGNPAAAVPALTSVINQQPLVSEAYLLLAKAYLSQRKPDEAVAVYRNMMNVFTNSPEVPFALGSLLMLQGKHQEARQAFENSLRVSPDFLPALEQIVDLDLSENLESAAMERVKKQLDKDPQSPLAWLLKAKVHMAKTLVLVGEANRKNPAGARELQVTDLPATANDVAQAEAALLKAIDLNPDLPTGYQLLAKLYVWSNKQQQALARLNALVAKTNDVLALTQIGIIHEQLRDYSAAGDAYERALKANPEAFEALNNLANLYAQRLNRLDRAYELADKANRLQPTNPYAADTLGWILYQRGEYPRALSLIEASAAKLTSDPEIQYHLGVAHYILDEEDPARLALERASRGTKDFPGKDSAAARLALLALDPKTAGPDASATLEKRLREAPNDPVALQRLAAIQQRDGAFEKAAKTYQQASEVLPQNAALKLKLADLYDQHLNDPAKAFDLAKQAHKLSADDPQISHLLGRLAFQNKDYKWAAGLLEECRLKLPDDPELSYDLAWSYFSLGQLPDAQSAMQKCCDASHSESGNASRKQAAQDFLQLTAAAQDPVPAQPAADRAQKLLATAPDYAPALLVCARAREQQAAYGEAARLYEKVLAQYPSFLPAVRSLALLYFARLNDEQRAYDYATKARESFPDDPEIAKALGVLSYRRKDYSRSAQLLEQSARGRTEDAEVFFYLGMARYQLNQRTQSKEKLQRALALNSAATFADDARRVLHEIQ